MRTPRSSSFPTPRVRARCRIATVRPDARPNSTVESSAEAAAPAPPKAARRAERVRRAWSSARSSAHKHTLREIPRPSWAVSKQPRGHAGDAAGRELVARATPERGATESTEFTAAVSAASAPLREGRCKAQRMRRRRSTCLPASAASAAAPERSQLLWKRLARTKQRQRDAAHFLPVQPWTRPTRPHGVSPAPVGKRACSRSGHACHAESHHADGRREEQ